MEIKGEFNKFMEDFKKLQEEFQEKKNQAAAALKTSLYETVKEVFDELPEIHSFSWAQYTPYFNDGEPCVFGKNDCNVEFYVRDEETGELLDEVDESEFDSWTARCVLKGEKHSWIPETVYTLSQEKMDKLSAVMDFLDGLDEDVCEVAFDEGRVVITREGLEVEEYEHD